MRTHLEEHMKNLSEELEERFPERPALVAWVNTCIEVKLDGSATQLGQEDALKDLAESDGCVDFQEWIEAASQALDDTFLQEHASDRAFVEKGSALIRRRQKNLYPWRTSNLDDHRPNYLEGNDLDFPTNEDN